jgi:hypothetical protein
MRVRALVGFAGLGGALAIASVAAIGIFSLEPVNVADADDAVASIEPVSVVETKQDRLPVARAARVDPLLLTPQPMLGPGSRPSRALALAAAEPVHEPDTDVITSLRPASPPVEARRTVPPPRLEKDGTLTVEQIARIKANLHLTPEQEQHWPPVEAELRAIAHQMAADKAAGKPKVTFTADTAQRLYWAAGPLIMSLRDDQKQEVRRLARLMGLAQVASLI